MTQKTAEELHFVYNFTSTKYVMGIHNMYFFSLLLQCDLRRCASQTKGQNEHNNVH